MSSVSDSIWTNRPDSPATGPSSRAGPPSSSSRRTRASPESARSRPRAVHRGDHRRGEVPVSARRRGPLDVERLWQELLTEDLYWDREGQGVSAASGVDIALWDVAGKYHGEPVHRLLGGDTTDDGRLQAYASDLFFDDPEVMAERAAGYVERGSPP
ncbi:hypothetical protein [Halospeciosus flavus]|uniref:hypothetical protein n=1 Tax=Halospeciosus flavus TaxID=3032283 RepID=UPI0036220CCA